MTCRHVVNYNFIVEYVINDMNSLMKNFINTWGLGWGYLKQLDKNWQHRLKAYSHPKWSGYTWFVKNKSWSDNIWMITDDEMVGWLLAPEVTSTILICSNIVFRCMLSLSKLDSVIWFFDKNSKFQTCQTLGWICRRY